ncbi:hypothetical protein HJFPF1_11606 [Paramyrothecium foliicola]|nr:hypothetical protein HJFPF1_11606 [Paramyrothecium foliicola]
MSDNSSENASREAGHSTVEPDVRGSRGESRTHERPMSAPNTAATNTAATNTAAPAPLAVRRPVGRPRGPAPSNVEDGEMADDAAQRRAKHPWTDPSRSSLAGATLPANETAPAPKKRGRPPRKRPVEVTVDVDEFLGGIIEQDYMQELKEEWASWKPSIGEARQMLESKQPQVSTVERLVQTAHPAGWAPEDEARLMEDFGASEEKTAFEKLVGNAHLLMVWKISVHLYRCTPFQIVDPWIGLFFEGAKGSSSAVWSGNFCISLAKIMTHPFWDGHDFLISFFIRFAVACRTDDRRPLVKSKMTFTCSVMDQLQLATRCTLTENIHDVHSDLRSGAQRQHQLTSQISDVLFELGKVVRSKPYCTPDPQGRYPARTDDLTSILQTLDSFKGRGWGPIFSPSDSIYAKYVRLRGESAAPSRNDLPRYHAAAYLNAIRGQRVYHPLTIDPRRNVPEDSEDLDLADLESHIAGHDGPSVDGREDVDIDLYSGFQQAEDGINSPMNDADDLELPEWESNDLAGHDGPGIGRENEGFDLEAGYDQAENDTVSPMSDLEHGVEADGMEWQPSRPRIVVLIPSRPTVCSEEQSPQGQRQSFSSLDEGLPGDLSDNGGFDLVLGSPVLDAE